MASPRLTPVAQRALNAERKLAEVSAERDILREALKDFAEWGIRADTDPTVYGEGAGTKVHGDLVKHIHRMDELVRKQAKDALRKAFDS